ncbi:MAG TPA: hypothetical protein VGM82_18935 [Gemmatimonadaceae bacterium]|jgi:hypothetical protein
MGFRDDWARMSRRAMDDVQTVFVNSASHAYESIVNGSPVTGAPGQPVDTGRLRASWQLEFLDANTAKISTKLSYAEAVENKWRGASFKNHGPHSVKLTEAGFAQIVAYETALVRRKRTGGG